MHRPRFATYMHPEITALSKPPESIRFVGKSWPHFAEILRELAERLRAYPALPLRVAPLDTFASVHTATYLEQIQLMAADMPPSVLPRLSAECIGMEHCLPGYQASLGGMLEAIDHMRAGALDRAYCFSLGGHHAYADWGHGYCLLNPLAATVRYAQARGFAHVVVVDWDIHHGDGTQAIFANDPTVRCISLHSAADFYMASACGLYVGTTAAAAEVGQCNIPILNTVFDDSFFEQMQLPGRFYCAHEAPAALRDALEDLPWEPDLVCIFAGYDGHRDDCGRQITGWTDDDFGLLTRMVLDRAAAAGCPVLSIHGGGYNPPVTIASAERLVEVLASYWPENA